MAARLGTIGALRKELVERALLCGLLGCPRVGERELIGSGCAQRSLNLANAIHVGEFEGRFELGEVL